MIDKSMIDNPEFIIEGMEVEISIHTETNEVLLCELPASIEVKITYTEPGVKGDTATNATKLAKIETGAEIQVPLFINEGDKIKIDLKESLLLIITRKRKKTNNMQIWKKGIYNIV